MSDEPEIRWTAECLAKQITHAAVIDHPTKCHGNMRRWAGFITDIYQDVCSDGVVNLRFKGYFSTDRSDQLFRKEFSLGEVTRFVNADDPNPGPIPLERLGAFLRHVAAIANDEVGDPVWHEAADPPAVTQLAPTEAGARRWWTRLLARG